MFLSVVLAVTAAYALPVEAQDKAGHRALNLGAHIEALERFRDCSTRFWYDRKRSLLIGIDIELAVPKGAVSRIGGSHVRIAVTARLNGLGVESLSVPTSRLSKESWNMNHAVVAGKIDDVRDVLSQRWSASFVKGVPEGPDVDPDAVAYYSDPPEGRPMLEANSPSSGRTTISCPVRAG